MKKTQLETVRKILLKKGKIDNRTAIMELGIWRLSDLIFKLRNEGMRIEGGFMVRNKKLTKVYEYRYSADDYQAKDFQSIKKPADEKRKKFDIVKSAISAWNK